MGIWAEVGIDPVELITCLQKERDELMGGPDASRRLGAVQGFVVPTLRRLGLLSERVAAHYHEFLYANLAGRLVGENVAEFMACIPSMPEDTAAFYLYVEGNAFAAATFQVVHSDGTSSGPITINGSSGATYFGFYTPCGTLEALTVTNTDGAAQGFAIGEFGIATQPNN